MLSIRYGAKVIKLEKGKAAIAVGEKTKLVSVINAVIVAVNLNFVIQTLEIN